MRDSTRFEKVEEIHGLKFIRKKNGGMTWFREALSAAEGAETRMGRAVSRAFKLANDDDDLERLEWFVDGVASLIGAMREEIEKRRGIRTMEERIALLRNTSGRSPEEAALYSAKADELEQRLKEAS